MIIYFEVKEHYEKILKEMQYVWLLGLLFYGMQVQCSTFSLLLAVI